MPNTPRGYPYPSDTDPADVPADMQAALGAVDTDVTTVEVGVTNNKNDIATLQAGEWTTHATSVYSNAVHEILGDPKQSLGGDGGPWTAVFANPYAFDVTVQVWFRSFLYAIDNAQTVYQEVRGTGTGVTAVVEEESRHQYNGQSGTWFTQAASQSLFTVPASTTATFEVLANTTQSGQPEPPYFRYGTLAYSVIGKA